MTCLETICDLWRIKHFNFMVGCAPQGTEPPYKKSVRTYTCSYLPYLPYLPFHSIFSLPTDTLHLPNVSCFSHIHTLPFFRQSSSHVSHQTTSAHTHDHTYTPTTFQNQTSHHSPHPSVLHNFQPDTPLPPHPKSLSISIQIHLHHSSSIHNISSIQVFLNTAYLINMSEKYFNFFIPLTHFPISHSFPRILLISRYIRIRV